MFRLRNQTSECHDGIGHHSKKTSQQRIDLGTSMRTQERHQIKINQLRHMCNFNYLKIISQLKYDRTLKDVS